MAAMSDDLSSQLAALRIDREATAAPSRAKAWLLWGLALVGAAALAYYVAYPRLEAQLFKTSVAYTSVRTVSPAQASVTLTAAGYVEARRTSRVAPKVPGKVAEVFVSQGQLVERGQVLLALDPADDAANVAAAESRAKAAWARAQSERAQAETMAAELEEGKQQAQRQQRLAAEGIGATGVAEDLVARVRSLERRVAAARASAEASVAEAKARGAEVEVLKTGLKNLKLEAPIAGTVVNRPPQVGEFVGPQPPGVSVDMGGVEIADFESLMVEIDVPEQRLHLVKPGGPAEIVLDAFPSSRYRGRTTEITPQVNRSKATVMVRVAFVDEKEGVLPDMAARVSFLDKALDETAVKEPPKTVVPAAAVAERAGAKVVFVVEDGVAHMRPVELGPPLAGGYELIRGPRSGTTLVSNPEPTLADGQRIKENEE